MEDHIYKKVEVVGSSRTTLEDAIRNAVSRTSENIRHMRWFEVSEIRGDLDNGQVAHWQVTVKIGFTVED